MKKIFSFVLGIFVFIVGASNVSAACSISISGPSSAISGNTFSVSVNLRGSGLGTATMLLNYDSSMLDLVGSTADNGTRMFKETDGAGGFSAATYNFSFRAKKTGSASISVGSYDIVDMNAGDLTCTNSGKTVKIMTQAELEASYSKNNNLKGLEVEGFEITPAFSPDVLEYSVTVPEDTAAVNVKAIVADNTATVSGEGSLEVQLGTNKFDIVVRAQNGSEKTYSLIVDVKDSNPINVKVAGKDLTVVKVASVLTKPDGFSESIVKISDVDIPAFKHDVVGIILVGLKNEQGEVGLYIYDEKASSYTKFFVISSGNISLLPGKMEATLEGYHKDTLDIDGEKIECLTLSSNKRYRVVFGKNLFSEEEGLFLYDTKDKSLIKYDDKFVSEYIEKINVLKYIVIGFAGALFFALVLIISLVAKKGKKAKKRKADTKQSSKVLEEPVENQIIEDNSIKESVKEDE